MCMQVSAALQQPATSSALGKDAAASALAGTARLHARLQQLAVTLLRCAFLMPGGGACVGGGEAGIGGSAGGVGRASGSGTGGRGAIASGSDGNALAGGSSSSSGSGRGKVSSNSGSSSVHEAESRGSDLMTLLLSVSDPDGGRDQLLPAANTVFHLDADVAAALKEVRNADAMCATYSSLRAVDHSSKMRPSSLTQMLQGLVQFTGCVIYSNFMGDLSTGCVHGQLWFIAVGTFVPFTRRALSSWTTPSSTTCWRSSMGSVLQSRQSCDGAPVTSKVAAAAVMQPLETARGPVVVLGAA